jgi:hypothetical protein
MQPSRRFSITPAGLVLRAVILVATLVTAYIHSTLGGALFTLNALGYAVFAVAMIVPIAPAIRFRWLVRVGLLGYAATTIIGWAIQGPFYMTAYVAKADELLLIGLLVIDFARADGNPIALVRRELGLLAVRLGFRSAAGSQA